MFDFQELLNTIKMSHLLIATCQDVPFLGRGTCDGSKVYNSIDCIKQKHGLYHCSNNSNFMLLLKDLLLMLLKC